MRLYKIGEFSKMTALTVKTLRYYDQVDLLKPTEVEEANGYRLYDERAYRQALVIQILRKHEFSIQEMLEALPLIDEPEDLAAFLKDKHQQLEAAILKSQRQQAALEKEILSLKEEKHMTMNNPMVEVKMIPETLIATLRYKGKYTDFGQYIGELMRAVGGSACGPMMALYHDDSYMEEGADIEVAIPVKKAIEKGNVHSRMLPAQRCVSYVHIGPYDKLSQSYKILADFTHEQDLQTQTPSREVYLKGPGMLLKGNPEKYETEILIPIQE